MAHKFHLRANRPDGARAPFAICAARSTGSGKVRNNARAYRDIPQSKILGPLDFRLAGVADPESVCAHCCLAGRDRLNRRLAAEGRPLVGSYFDRIAPTDESTEALAA